MQFHLKPTAAAPVTTDHLTAFVTADLRFDIAAIRADAKVRYGAKLDFINRYTGSAQRHWQWVQARRAVELAWREAKRQLHGIVFDRMPRQLPYTATERARMDTLRAQMGSAAIDSHGNCDFKAASVEYAQISFNVQQRAYQQIVATARGES